MAGSLKFHDCLFKLMPIWQRNYVQKGQLERRFRAPAGRAGWPRPQDIFNRLSESPQLAALVGPSGAWHLLNWRLKLQNAVLLSQMPFSTIHV